MKKIVGILFLVLVLLGSFLKSKLNADFHVHSNLGNESIEVGLLWTSVKFNSGYINSHQWIRLPPMGGNYTFITNNPPVYTECFWLAIRNPGKGFRNYSYNGADLSFYRTFVVLPSNNRRVRLNDYNLAGMRGIGSTCFCGDMEKFYDKLKRDGYMPKKYDGVKIWSRLKETTQIRRLDVAISKGVDGKYNFDFLCFQ